MLPLTLHPYFPPRLQFAFPIYAMVEKALNVHTGAYWKRVGVRIPVGRCCGWWMMLSAPVHRELPAKVPFPSNSLNCQCPFMCRPAAVADRAGLPLLWCH
jgi:hypothetical protein